MDENAFCLFPKSLDNNIYLLLSLRGAALQLFDLVCRHNEVVTLWPSGITAASFNQLKPLGTRSRENGVEMVLVAAVGSQYRIMMVKRLSSYTLGVKWMENIVFRLILCPI